MVSYSPGVRASSVKVIYDFLGDNAAGPHLGDPTAGLTQDAAGNLYGTVFGFPGASATNPSKQGAVFELIRPAAGSSVWSEKTLFQPPPSANWVYIAAGVKFDSKGNLYGITKGTGGAGAGAFVFKLAPPANGSDHWAETTLAQPFTDPTATPLIGADHSLYVSDITGVFTVSPPASSGGSWTIQRIYSFPYGGTATSLIPDSK